MHRAGGRNGNCGSLVAVALAILPRLDAVPFRGEEHRRMQVAEEMAAHGDWVVPREQGQVFLSRPAAAAVGDRAVESGIPPTTTDWPALPCALAVLLTSVLLYGYSRQFVGRLGASSRRWHTRPAVKCSVRRSKPRPKRSSSS